MKNDFLCLLSYWRYPRKQILRQSWRKCGEGYSGNQHVIRGGPESEQSLQTRQRWEVGVTMNQVWGLGDKRYPEVMRGAVNCVRPRVWWCHSIYLCKIKFYMSQSSNSVAFCLYASLYFSFPPCFGDFLSLFIIDSIFSLDINWKLMKASELTLHPPLLLIYMAVYVTYTYCISRQLKAMGNCSVHLET